MVLNELETAYRIAKGEIIVTPLIDPMAQFGPSSLDVRLGTEFQVTRRSRLTHLDPLQQADRVIGELHEYTEDFAIGSLGYFVLHPGEFALACTLEYIRLPHDLVARLEGRSSWGRLGLEVHATAGYVDPGFGGHLTFELKNVGKLPMPLHPGVRIAQLSFYHCLETSRPYPRKSYAKYQGQVGVIGSMYYKDPEFRKIREARQSGSSEPK